MAKAKPTPPGVTVTRRIVEIRGESYDHPLRAAAYEASLLGGDPLEFEGKRWRVESLVYDSHTVWDGAEKPTGSIVGWNARLVEVSS